MLNDPEFLGEVRKTFEASNFSIEYVLNQKTEEYANKLRSSGNAYLAERAESRCDSVYGFRAIAYFLVEELAAA